MSIAGELARFVTGTRVNELRYKYCVSQMAWSRARVLPPPDVKLTPRQQALLTEPADPHTFIPSLFSDEPGAER
jgi:hypothetical protein